MRPALAALAALAVLATAACRTTQPAASNDDTRQPPNEVGQEQVQTVPAEPPGPGSPMGDPFEDAGTRDGGAPDAGMP
ncbi:hypothetical protein FGE12_12370 [Aggregicoccus sp. 17bor-14]|uniref:hypothetical protein n=1 Tax=Myxococcaceae TaxID=31 RepID=UPI00129C5B5C|nr:MULTISPECIES: hypothetical protein [Myxococcaceae]MBF5043185.1 hypothetical protein [Simulacricoccus sp. 17bor-14]MRI88943.1 hypothetical protein [Aggregicoccus sp. 17bor-14]